MIRPALVLSLLMSALATPALADSFPYPNPGTIAQTTMIYATGGGGIQAYYLGSSAGYEDQVEIYDVQTGYNSGKILDNKTTSPGTLFSVGTAPGQINLGDQLILFLDSPEGKFASVGAKSVDGVNHSYLASYAGGSVNGYQIPPGYFVGMEDLSAGKSDFDYNDDAFYLTGVSAAAATPELGSLWLLGTGVLCLVGIQKLRKQDEL